jgi:hypothetical protein
MRATANIAAVREYAPVIEVVDRVLAANGAAAKAAHAVNTAATAFAAPFIGLAFVVGFPLIGFAVLAWVAARALAARWKGAARFAKNVALFAAAPFVGLAYAIAFPFVGIGALAWLGARAAVKGLARN